MDSPRSQQPALAGLEPPLTMPADAVPVPTPADDENNEDDDDDDDDTPAAIQRACQGASLAECLSIILPYTRRPGGLRTDGCRRVTWPILLECSDARVANSSGREKLSESGSNSTATSANWRDLLPHRDEDQVRLDVDRSFVYYPSNRSESQIAVLKADLLQVITATLRRHPKLCYFQGFHDIVQVLMLVLGKDLAVEAVSHLSLLRLRDFMLPSLSPSLTQLQLLPAILMAADPRLARHVSRGRPFFALAATITMFAHEIESYTDITRLFDFLLAEEAAIVLYLFAAILISRRDEIFDIPPDEEDMLSFKLSKLPRPLDVEAIIQTCIKLVQEHPPDQLPRGVWGKVPKFSVLRTTRRDGFSSLADAERFFDAQLTRLAWQEQGQKIVTALWIYRRPVGGIGATVLVAVLSYWLQRGTGASIVSSMTNQLANLTTRTLQLVQA